eukprot:CAMPEP_0118922316 /NCGR_PEP_ID=MMETSP1169-20130426/1286_1 /TAXON_ID=36882 /ORGANISM="Pyramimonas obovata, Strain CCMP722" /LENGTH=94 /DNA_ID=CAMNT_0006863161 /DNA_START=143 /DNA_END=427 /DNA_ORIENTATION=+
MFDTSCSDRIGVMECEGEKVDRAWSTVGGTVGPHRSRHTSVEDDTWTSTQCILPRRASLRASRRPCLDAITEYPIAEWCICALDADESCKQRIR